MSIGDVICGARVPKKKRKKNKVYSDFILIRN